MQALREYVRADLDRMVALDRECFAAAFLFSRSAMKRFAEARDAIVLIVGPQDGALTGFVIAHLERQAGETVGYVVTLDVAPAFRRAGVAGMLICEVERRAAAAGAVQMILHVFVENEPAIRFYERQGYRRIGHEPKFYGRSGMDAYVYSKSLQNASSE